MRFWPTKLLAALKLLLRSPFYLILALVLAFILFVIYFVVNDLALYRSAAAINGSLPFLWRIFTNHIRTVWTAVGGLHPISIGFISALGGINLSLIALRTKRTGVFLGRPGILSFFGSLAGAFAASCSACSTALISLLGVTGGLAILPFGGLEISLLALVILLISFYYIAKSLFEFGLTG